MNGKTFSATATLPAVPAMNATSLHADQTGLSIMQEQDAGEVVIHIPAAWVPRFFDELLGILVNREGKG